MVGSTDEDENVLIAGIFNVCPNLPLFDCDAVGRASQSTAETNSWIFLKSFAPYFVFIVDILSFALICLFDAVSEDNFSNIV